MSAASISLRVKKALPADAGHGRARLDAKSREVLNIRFGDVIEIRGEKITCAVALNLPQNEQDRGMIRIDGLIRKNAGVSVDDYVTVSGARTRPAERVVIGLETSEFLNDPNFVDFVKKSLLRRPLMAGDINALPNTLLTGKVVPFRVASTDPEGIVIVHEGTELLIKEKVEGEVAVTGITYEDIGGLKEELMRVREMVEFPLKRPELFKRVGIEPPRGLLLYGPPGTGKTLIARAVANECGATFLSIQGPEIMSKYYGESEEQLRRKFEMAKDHAPAIIFIDEIDSIAPRREDVSGEVERRVVAQLLTLMDGLKGRGNVIVVAATNRIDAVDPALRRPGRFDREIMIGVPDRNSRKEILQIHTRGMPLSPEFDLDLLADLTHGFTGADLAALSREAAMRALRRFLPTIDLDKAIPTDVLEQIVVTFEDFLEALKGVEPSALREFFFEIPEVRWDDIGGLEDVIQQLREAVEWPIKRPEVFTRMGIRPPRGILLFGPPGTGKTLLAKAVATEINANFIPVRGPEVMSKWVGESERAVREIFRLAKQAAPSVILLDELDAIAPSRGLGMGRAHEQVVNQLLTSLDGLEKMSGVVVIATTNRPDIIDPALLRAGRFDRRIYVPPPSRDSRLKILRVHTRYVPLRNVDLEHIADRTDGFVGADIEALCREAAMLALRENQEAEGVEMRHFEMALEVVAPSVEKTTLDFYDKIAEELAGTGRRLMERIAGYE